MKLLIIGEKVSDMETNDSTQSSEDDAEWNVMGAELEKGFLDDED